MNPSSDDTIDLKVTQCYQDLLKLVITNCNDEIKMSFQNCMEHLLRIANMFTTGKIFKETEALRNSIVTQKQEH